MIRLLRSVIDFEDGKIDQETLSINFRHLLGSSIQWNRPDDERLFKFIKTYFEHNLPNLPSAQTVEDYFNKSNDIETIERLKDIEGQPVYTDANFTFLLRQLLDEQNKIRMLKLLKDTQEVVSKGLEVKEGRETKIYKGTTEAHLFYNARAVDLLPTVSNTRTRGDLRTLTEESWEEYLAAEHDSSKAYGKLTGINDIDKVCKGIKKGEMWVHAGFAGELKSSYSMNWCYNLVTRYRTNVFYVSLEMPLEQVQRIIHVLHSANGKFAAQGKEPLDYRKVRDGELSPEEKEFYKEVLHDFANNPNYTRFEIWCPDRDVTIDDIRIEAELMHRQMEVGLLVIDHGGLVEAQRRNSNYTVELNTVLRGSKKLALHFNGGEGVPLLMLFQINRDGKDQADKNDGAYKMRALSYANECLAEGTLVRTSMGLIPIEKVEPGYLVHSSTGWKTVSHRFNQGVRKTVAVITDGGIRVTCTPDHRFQTIGEDGLKWVEAKDLKGLYALADMPHYDTLWPIGSLYSRLCEKYRVPRQNLITSSALDSLLSFDNTGLMLEEDLALLRRLLSCHPQQVVAVKEGPEVPVFDLEVSGDHEYSTGGLLTHNCERSADVITTTYLNDQHRQAGTTVCCNLKNRDNPLFEKMLIGVDFKCRRLKNYDISQVEGHGMGCEDPDDVLGMV
jgi:replicative DNA helicase